jgi:tRNA threonylcarbamoyladenosine biosynthesis protein TsaB
VSYILNIDTAAEIASVSISSEGAIIGFLENIIQKDHASFLHPAIEVVLKNAGIRLADIDAIAVNAGPGSYTGLRVGMASAKGLCFALEKPLISVGALPVMASAISKKYDNQALLCPMIDARRMEVFTAVYNGELYTQMEAGPLILEKNSFDQFLDIAPVVFIGSGMHKWKTICKHSNAIFDEQSSFNEALAFTAFKHFHDNLFTPLAYSEPLYLKGFHDDSARK